ncbi:MAG: hypothetical protein HY744_13185 [Deltaproteobacteria bacterium]|nr:hypothetical protein [Deltaproteobacteria bacterium]
MSGAQERSGGPPRPDRHGSAQGEAARAGAKPLCPEGADDARAYVPPTTLKPQRARPAIEPQKVRLAPGLDPGAEPTAPGKGAVVAPAATAQTPSSPGPVAEGPRADVLPFLPPGEAQTPVAAAADVGVVTPAGAATPLAPPVAEPAAAAPQEDEPGAAASPWSAERKLDAELLPSASFALTAAPVVQPAVALAPQGPLAAVSERSRAMFIAGLVVAAVALVGVIVYLATRPSTRSDDPTSVHARGNQVDIEDAPAASPAASASTLRPTQPAVRTRPKSEPEDIYGDDRPALKPSQPKSGGGKKGGGSDPFDERL